MSDSFISLLYAVHEVYMTNCFDEKVSRLLTEKDIPRADWLKDHRKSATRCLAIVSRGNWFSSHIESAFFSLDPSNEGLGEGAEFAFCVKNHRRCDALREVAEVLDGV